MKKLMILAFLVAVTTTYSDISTSVMVGAAATGTIKRELEELENKVTNEIVIVDRREKLIEAHKNKDLVCGVLATITQYGKASKEAVKEIAALKDENIVYKSYVFTNKEVTVRILYIEKNK
ncbi:hypothetical protein [Fusobacterium sp. THCT1E2]